MHENTTLDLDPYPSDGRKTGVAIVQPGLPLPQSGRLLAGLESLEIILQFLLYRASWSSL